MTVMTDIADISESAVTEGVDSNTGPAPDSRPKARPVGPVAIGRVIAMTVAVFAVAAGAVAALAPLSHRAGVNVLAISIGLLIVPLVASPLEWFVHRFVYHEAVVAPLAAIFKVHTAHHYAYFPTWRYVTNGPARRLAIRSRAPYAHTSRLRNAGVRLAHFMWYQAIGLVVIWIPSWFATHNPYLLVAEIASTAIVGNLFIVVHDTIHRPGSHRIVEAQPWYPFLDRHHYIHHIELGKNLNFLLPLADLLFGTLSRTITADDLAAHGTLETAKAVRIGEGEPARLALPLH